MTLTTEVLDVTAWFQQGHEAALAGRSAAACEPWLRCWDVFRSRFPTRALPIEAAQALCPELPEPLVEWLRDLDEELAEGALRSAACRDRRLSFCDEVLQGLELDDERLGFLCSRACSLWDMRQREAAEAAFREAAAAWPHLAGAFVRWGDCWAFDRIPDFERAESIYRQGLLPPEQCDLRTISHRLTMLERLRASADEKAAKKSARKSR